MQKRLKYLRAELGLTQSAFGTELGFAAITIAAWESGKRNPKEQTLNAICTRYNVRSAWLRQGEGPIFESKSIGSMSERTDDEVEMEYILRVYRRLPLGIQMKCFEEIKAIMLAVEKNSVEPTEPQNAVSP